MLVSTSFEVLRRVRRRFAFPHPGIATREARDSRRRPSGAALRKWQRANDFGLAHPARVVSGIRPLLTLQCHVRC